ncbi:hypothetical protein BC629DRAFT_1062615 [Irpex lacteus]|nr:hypothetical protein BC629DRAFT_1062615 [Irpex lacteus]
MFSLTTIWNFNVFLSHDLRKTYSPSLSLCAISRFSHALQRTHALKESRHPIFDFAVYIPFCKHRHTFGFICCCMRPFILPLHHHRTNTRQCSFHPTIFIFISFYARSKLSTSQPHMIFFVSPQSHNRKRNRTHHASRFPTHTQYLGFFLWLYTSSGVVSRRGEEGALQRGCKTSQDERR